MCALTTQYKRMSCVCVCERFHTLTAALTQNTHVEEEGIEPSLPQIKLRYFIVCDKTCEYLTVSSTLGTLTTLISMRVFVDRTQCSHCVCDYSVRVCECTVRVCDF